MAATIIVSAGFLCFFLFEKEIFQQESHCQNHGKID